ncbi:MAG: hypothetical protein NTY04_04230 [Candidatus Staskawiczbacteria bacterium]|nr:hypothetical protein [Candidatus Staskawiczbacteria bacterium]
MTAKNETRDVIVNKLMTLANLLIDPQPESPAWRRSVKKSMDAFQSIIQGKHGKKSLSPARAQELEHKLAEFKAMVSRILGGDGWVVIIYGLRQAALNQENVLGWRKPRKSRK